MMKQYAWSLLILRLSLGFSFAMHGFSKFSGGIENTSRCCIRLIMRCFRRREC